MRRRRSYSPRQVLFGSFLISGLVHSLLASPLRDSFNDYLAKNTGVSAVRVVQMSPDAWSGSLAAAYRSAGRKAPSDAERKAMEAKRKAKAKSEDRLTGQVVEVPPTANDAPNPDAKYLSKYNSHVDKETVARMEARDSSRKRVSHRLENKRRPPSPTEGLVTPGLTVVPKKKPGVAKSPAKKKRGEKFALEIPDLKPRDSVQLKLSDLPGLKYQVPNRAASEGLQGNSERFRLGKGEKGSGKGVGEGSSHGLPTLSALAPALGITGAADGSPSRDHVEGLPEGDGTFLNAKEFKFATFFYRVRDSVASHWEDLAVAEYRRRDPSGNIYGGRDRATLLHIRLDRAGNINQVRVETTSGVDFLDEVAVKAFNLAQPFPNPPSGIVDADGSIRFNFQFVVTMRSRSPLNIFRFQ